MHEIRRPNLSGLHLTLLHHHTRIQLPLILCGDTVTIEIRKTHWSAQHLHKIPPPTPVCEGIGWRWTRDESFMGLVANLKSLKVVL
jgi:hypothetical protein